MSKTRINDLARELEVKSRAILDVLTEVGVTEKKTHSSSLENFEAEKVRVHFQARASSSASSRATRAARADTDEIKTKIDLSHISRPGDVMRAITERAQATAHPPTTAAVPPPLPAAVPPLVPKAPVVSAPAAKAAPVAPAPRFITPQPRVAPPIISRPAPPVLTPPVVTPPVAATHAPVVEAPPAEAVAPPPPPAALRESTDAH